MPRKNRVHYVAALYHVMLRGNNRQTIFFSDDDKVRFEHHLNRVCQLYNCKIHLYCLMTNHTHLVIEVDRVPLSKIMMSLNSAYTREINRKHQRVGHLFQGRYLAKLVQSEQYLLELCYYIHNNPLKANMVDHIDDYPWSSHPDYLNQKQTPWLTKSYILSLIANHCHQQTFANIYQDFINNKSYLENAEFFTFEKDGTLRIKDQIKESMNKPEKYDLSNVSFEEIKRRVIKRMGVDANELASPSLERKVCLARNLIAYFAYYRARYQLQDIASNFARQPNSLSKSLHRMIRSISEDRKLNRLIKELEEQLSVNEMDSWVS